MILSQDGFGILRLELPLTAFIALASFVGLVLPACLVTAATDGKAGVLLRGRGETPIFNNA